MRELARSCVMLTAAGVVALVFLLEDRIGQLEVELGMVKGELEFRRGYMGADEAAPAPT